MRLSANGHEATFGGRTVLKLDCGDVAQLCGCMKKSLNGTFLWYLNYTSGKLKYKNHI